MNLSKEPIVYKVKTREILREIAKKYNVPVEALAYANNIKLENMGKLLLIGGIIIIPSVLHKHTDMTHIQDSQSKEKKENDFPLDINLTTEEKQFLFDFSSKSQPEEKKANFLKRIINLFKEQEIVHPPQLKPTFIHYDKDTRVLTATDEKPIIRVVENDGIYTGFMGGAGPSEYRHSKNNIKETIITQYPGKKKTFSGGIRPEKTNEPIAIPPEYPYVPKNNEKENYLNDTQAYFLYKNYKNINLMMGNQIRLVILEMIIPNKKENEILENYNEAKFWISSNDDRGEQGHFFISIHEMAYNLQKGIYRDTNEKFPIFIT